MTFSATETTVEKDGAQRLLDAGESAGVLMPTGTALHDVPVDPTTHLAAADIENIGAELNAIRDQVSTSDLTRIERIDHD
ncbi:hypothetical protein ACX9NE_15115 [Mycobacterium sp. ML4]